MKIVKKIMLVMLTIMLTIAFIPQSNIATATNMNCSPYLGKDIIFVINDTPAMSAIELTIDSNSEEGYISEIIQFVHSLDNKDRVGVFGFNEDLTRKLPLDSNKFKIESELKKFLTPSTSGGNDLSAGIQAALSEFEANSSSNEKMIIVLTTGSSINNQKLLQLAEEANEEQVTINIFGFGSTDSIDSKNLTTIANLTEGQYYHITRLSDLNRNLSMLFNSTSGFTGEVISSDYTLQDDQYYPNGLLIQENVKVNLNGYDLTVDGDLIIQKCAELRAVNGGIIEADSIDQRANSIILLNNSQLIVNDTFEQNGIVRLNGQFGVNKSTPELKINEYIQKSHGILELNGQNIEVDRDFTQKGVVNQQGGNIVVNNDLLQQGDFNVQGGELIIGGNLTIDGGPLVDEQFKENKSLDVGQGYVKVGSSETMKENSSKGNVYQLDGQFYINHGTVEIFGDYSVSNGWLTMIKGSMDTTVEEYGRGDGDFVHVYGDFSMASQRNHGLREYSQLGVPMNDIGHLTDGVLQVDGNFNQFGNQEYHSKYSDKSQNYEKNYSKYNFYASGRHKVLLTGKNSINVESSNFKFNILEVSGKITDYNKSGNIRWNQLIERSVSSNAKLKSLHINDISVPEFNSNKYTYFITVPAESFTEGARSVKVDAIPVDARNADVQVLSSTLNSDGTGKVVVLVTANDGKTTATYTVYVSTDGRSDGRVTSIEFEQKEFVFLQNNDYTFSPAKETIKYTVYPKTANQRVEWKSTDESVVIVRDGIITPVGIGVATVIATTEDGNFTDAAIVKVVTATDLIAGIETLEDLISDSKRFDEITATYSLDNIGIVVPGKYIQSLEFNRSSSGYLQGGEIVTDDSVDRVAVSVNGVQLPVPTPSVSNVYTFTRAGLKSGDKIEVIAYNSAGDELERIYTEYPVDFRPNLNIPSGYYSLQSLIDDPMLFDLILQNYVLRDLRVEVR